MTHDIFAAPVNSPLILLLSVAYAIIESIRIYDARLIQAKTRGFDSAVAAEAAGQSLPAWVGSVHLAGWLVLILLLALNWKYAIALYALLFVLRVLPVLERIGATIMHPFLQPHGDPTTHVADVPPPVESDDDEAREIEGKLRENRAQLSKARQDLEELIHQLRPASTLDDFVPTFGTWWLRAGNQHLGLAEALEHYVQEFELYDSRYPDEPDRVTLARSILKVLESSNLSFEGRDARALFQYKTGLQMRVRGYDLRVSMGMDKPGSDPEPPT